MNTPIWKYFVEVTKESGEVIWSKQFLTEVAAHDQFEELEQIKSPLTFGGLTMNLSEYYTGGNIGTVRVVAENTDGGYFVRRELYRNA